MDRERGREREKSGEGEGEGEGKRVTDRERKGQNPLDPFPSTAYFFLSLSSSSQNFELTNELTCNGARTFMIPSAPKSPTSEHGCTMDQSSI